MKKISEMISWLFAALIAVWIGSMIMASSPCERVYKSSDPWTFSIGLVERLSQNWLEVETRISILRLKASGAIFIQEAFTKTFYGAQLKCKI